MTAADRVGRLPTAAKLLLILTAVLLPIGIALVWLGESGIRQANIALKGRAEDQSRAAAEAMEGLLARNALALQNCRECRAFTRAPERMRTRAAIARGRAGGCAKL